jgi:hypothetical protein
MLANHCRQLKAVEIRHADIDQDDGDIVFEQELQCFAARGGLDQVFSKLA